MLDNNILNFKKKYGEKKMSNYPQINSLNMPDTWKNKTKAWGHSLHKMCSRAGCFPPSLARYFICKYSEPGDKVLDPFSGKGTVPLEACLTNRVGIGYDIAPEAYVLTHSKVRPVPLSNIRNYIVSLKRKISYENFGNPEVDWQIKIFFHDDTLKQILAIRDFLIEKNSDKAIFTRALMCGIIHGSSDISLSLPCSHSFSMSPKYVQKYATKHGLTRPKKDVIACLEKKAERVLLNPLPKVQGEACKANASKIQLEDESIDLIVTSPPYFDKQTYAWDNWLRLWFLGYDYKKIAKKLIQTESKTKYVQLMAGCIDEMYRVLKNDSACFMVVGDANIRGGNVKTAELLIEPAESAGFKVKRIITDGIAHEEKYFMFVKKNHGTKIDRILELHKGNPKNNDKKINWDVMPAAEC